MNLFKKIKDVISASILCLRFPFLYPRNRFDDKYHADLLSDWAYKLERKGNQEISVTAKINKSNDYFTNNVAFLKYRVKWDGTTKQILIKDDKNELVKFNYSNIIWGNDKFEVLGIVLLFSISGTPIIQLQVKPIDESDNGNYGFAYCSSRFVVNKWYDFWYKAIIWFDTKVLDKILFLPSYTELDAMEPGWRKAFGIQMCKEIRRQLIKEKKLFKWRIVQLKEKFSGMRLYSNFASDELYNIIDKYVQISYRTCGVCGKPATKISKGWIYPYCDDCIGDRQFTEIDKNPFVN